MKKKLSLCLVFLCCVKFVVCARILAVMPTPSYSHQVVFNPLWLTLHSKGHQITLLTTDPIKNITSPHFRQIDWSFAYAVWHRKHNFTDIISNFKGNLIKCVIQYAAMMNDITDQELKHPEVEKIIRNQSEHFDLVIVEILNPAMMIFSHRFKCPFIGISPMDVPTFFHEALGNPTSPAAFSDFISSFDSEMSFFERLTNLFYYIGTKIYFKYHLYPKADDVVRKYFGKNIPKLEDVRKNASFIFLNTNPYIHDIRPLMPNVLSVGGGFHLEEDSSLPPDLLKFLDDSATGAIYFSLGTNALGRDLSENTRNIFIDTFKDLPYKIIWKYEDTHNINDSKFMIKSWLPQQSVLKHPNLKLFITQGGLQSLEETIFNSVPIIGIPVFLDQFSNIRRVVKKGIGISLDYDKIERLPLKRAILEIMTNDSYKRNVVELSNLMKDQLISGLDQTIFWTEYVINNKGAPLLKRSEIPLHQYLLLDQLLFYLAILFCTIFGVKYLWKKYRRNKRNKRLKLD